MEPQSAGWGLLLGKKREASERARAATGSSPPTPHGQCHATLEDEPPLMSTTSIVMKGGVSLDLATKTHLLLFDN